MNRTSGEIKTRTHYSESVAFFKETIAWNTFSLLIANGSIGTVKSMSPQQRPTTSLDKAFIIVEFEWLKRLDIPSGKSHFQHKKVHFSRLNIQCVSPVQAPSTNVKEKRAKDRIVLCPFFIMLTDQFFLLQIL
jgi:hypothetical protein